MVAQLGSSEVRQAILRKPVAGFHRIDASRPVPPLASGSQWWYTEVNSRFDALPLFVLAISRGNSFGELILVSTGEQLTSGSLAVSGLKLSYLAPASPALIDATAPAINSL